MIRGFQSKIQLEGWLLREVVFYASIYGSPHNQSYTEASVLIVQFAHQTTYRHSGLDGLSRSLNRWKRSIKQICIGLRVMNAHIQFFQNYAFQSTLLLDRIIGTSLHTDIKKAGLILNSTRLYTFYTILNPTLGLKCIEIVEFRNRQKVSWETIQGIDTQTNKDRWTQINHTQSLSASSTKHTGPPLNMSLNCQ